MEPMFSKKELRDLIIPLVLEQILAVTIGLADTMMVSSVGEAAVAGISGVDAINVLLINVFSALATGGAVVASQYLGRGDRENACSAAKQLIHSGALLSGVLGLLSLCFARYVLGALMGNVADDVMANAQTYFFYSAISYPFLSVYNSGAALFRSMGNSLVSFIVSIGMNALNIMGNAILIYGFNMGVAGAAIPTLTSRVVGAVVMMILLRNKNLTIHVRDLHKVEFKPDMIRRILQIGVPNGLENGMFQAGKVIVQRLINSYGTSAMAANAVAGNITSLAVLPGSAISLAMVTVVGQCIGARRPDEARSYTKLLMKMSYGSMTVLNILLALALPLILQLYGLTDATFALAQELILYHCVACILFWPSAFVLPNALRAAGDAKFTMTVSIVSMFTFRVVLSIILGTVLGMGVLGVWISMFIDWIFRLICFIKRYMGEKWLSKQLI